MRRRTALTVTLLLALALTTGATLTVVRPVAARPVYTVAQVQARLARRPKAWVGRTVLVWGTVLGWVDMSSRGGASPLSCLAPCSLAVAQQRGLLAPHLVLVPGVVAKHNPDLIAAVILLRRGALLLHMSSPSSYSSSLPLLTVVRDLPVLGPWLRATGLVPANESPVYRVRLLSTSPTVTPCHLGLQTCDDALLVGTHP